MKEAIIILVVLFAVVAHAEDFQVWALDVKVMKVEHGFTTVAFKVNVQNHSGGPGTIMVTIQGVDSQGFEVLSHNLRDKFTINQFKTLTDKRLFSKKDFDTVSKWQIKTAVKLED